MARLADDWEEMRQTCIDVLCAYLRTQNGMDPGSLEFTQGEKQVRLTIERLLGNHVKAGALTSWSANAFDLTEALLLEADFAGAEFMGKVIFTKATFPEGATFSNTLFSEETYFDQATFTGSASFHQTIFDAFVTFFQTAFGSSTWFMHTVSSEDTLFNSAKFFEVWFIESQFLGGVQFCETHFYGKATLQGLSFEHAPQFWGSEFAGEVAVEDLRSATPIEADDVHGMQVTMHPELNDVPFSDWPADLKWE